MSTITVATQITLVRIFLIPVFVGTAIYYGITVGEGAPDERLRWWTVGIFVFAAISDGIDGFVARRFNQRSQLGAILDPLADKGLLLAAILTLAFSQWQPEIPIWFAILVVARDIIIVSGSLLIKFVCGEVEVQPSWVGKTSTFFQMAAIAAALFNWPTLLGPLVWTAGFFTLWSGVGYVLKGVKFAQEHGRAAS